MMLNKIKSCFRLKVGRNNFAWLLLIFLMVAIAIGSSGQDSVKSDAKAKTSTEVPDANVGQISIADDMIKSVSFKKDIDLRDAVRFLAAKYQKNIIISPKVEGLSSVTTLYNVSFKEALEAILGKNFEYEDKGNVIEVFTRKDETRMKYRVFILRYISAAEAKTLVEPILSENGKVEVTSAAVTGVPTGASISSDTAGGDTMAVQDTVVVYDYAENIAKAEEVISAIDIRPKQVLIESTILSAKLTEDMQAGIDWQTLHGTISALSSISRSTDDYFGFAGTSQVTKTGGMTVGFSHDNIAGFVKALEEITDTTILANPKILAVNKQLGQVYIGTKLGYREGDVVTDGGATQEGAVKFLDTGTKLSFRPYIGDNGYIRMDIHSKDSSGSLSSGVPQEISAEVVSNIIVKDGETIVIGGLFRDETVTGRTQIPVFGDIPIVGMLFRGTADKVERHEVIVLLTPHIIKEAGETDGNLRAEDIKIRTTGVKNQLQSVNRTRLALDSYTKAAKYYIDGNYKKALQQLNETLRIHPSDLEAMRLKEKILSETDPTKFSTMKQRLFDDVEKDYSQKWKRK